jgi:hypothetical protein
VTPSWPAAGIGDEPVPIGEPDEDGELDDGDDDEDEDDDEEPLQVRGVAAGRGDAAMQHAAPNSGIINALR